MPTAKVKLSNHGSYLSEHLKNGSDGMKTDLVIRCSDGDFHLHRVVLAASLHSLAYLRALKTTEDEENQIIVIPDAKKSYINHLMSLLYTGRTENISAEEIDEINVVSDLLKISSLTLR